MVDASLPGPGLDPLGRFGAGAEGTAGQLRRGYAVAAAEALVQYLVRGFRFKIRTAEPGERIEPSRSGKRVIFTLPDWDAYTSLLRSHLDSWWQRNRGGSSKTE